MEAINLATKDRLLTLLIANKGKYSSGEEIASELNISRTAVWKAVKSLKDAGYKIDAVQNKGYSLIDENDILSYQGVKKYLSKQYTSIDLNVVASIDSTNKKVREMAIEGAKEGYTVIAASQTMGRGRRGRSFYSPKDTGVYLSILLRPKNYTPEQATRITTMAAVAVCEAIESISPEKAMIKWVNDIFIDNKKVCGILTEGAIDLETHYLDYAVLGIGINVYYPEGGFPEEIENTAGAVFKHVEDDCKNKIAAAILNNFMKYYLSDSVTEYTSRYKERNLAIGKDITILVGNSKTKAKAVDIDDDCHLIVRYDNGETEALSSGEISIRL